MKVGSLVRYKTKLVHAELPFGIVLRTLLGYETSDIMFSGEIVTCDWEDLEVLCELR